MKTHRHLAARQFLELSPALDDTGRPLTRRGASPYNERHVWTAYTAESGWYLRAGLRESNEDDKVLGYVVTAAPWQSIDDTANYLPPPPDPIESAKPPDRVRNPWRPPLAKTITQALNESDLLKILAQVDALDRLREALEPKLPARLRGQAHLTNVRDGTAVFLVRSPVFRAVLRQHEQSLITILSEMGVTVQRVLSRCGEIPSIMLSERTVLFVEKLQAASDLHRTAEMVDDDGLRKQLHVLADTLANKPKT